VQQTCEPGFMGMATALGGKLVRDSGDFLRVMPQGAQFS